MTENYKDVTEEENEFWKKIWRLDPMLFSRGYSAEKINKILRENGITGKLDRNVKSGHEVQREQMREQMGLTDTEGMTITEENAKKIISDLSKSRHIRGGVILDGVFYEDFRHFASALINKYFEKGEKNEENFNE